MEPIELSLPWPPSVNTYWRINTSSRKPGMLISREGREYRAEVAARVMLARASARITDLIRLTVELYPPDGRRRDTDNVLKAIFDALEFAGVYADDVQIHELHVIRQCQERPGHVDVRVEPLGISIDTWRGGCRG